MSEICFTVTTTTLGGPVMFESRQKLRYHNVFVTQCSVCVMLVRSRIVYEAKRLPMSILSLISPWPHPYITKDNSFIPPDWPCCFLLCHSGSNRAHSDFFIPITHCALLLTVHAIHTMHIFTSPSGVICPMGVGRFSSFHSLAPLSLQTLTLIYQSCRILI